MLCYMACISFGILCMRFQCESGLVTADLSGRPREHRVLAPFPRRVLLQCYAMLLCAMSLWIFQMSPLLLVPVRTLVSYTVAELLCVRLSDSECRLSL